MKSIVLSEPGTLSYADAPFPPAPGSGESLVRVHAVGICGTDYHAYRGRQPFFSFPRVLGHELGVEVLAVGPGPSAVVVGDRCAVEPYLHCGTCVACRRGKTNCCVNLTVLGVHRDGGMREQLLVPTAKLHPSKTLSLEQLALVETLGIGAHAVARAGLVRDDRVLVVGAGPIGLSAIQFAQLGADRVAVMDLDPHRREFCRAHFRVEAGLTGADPIGELHDWLDGELPTVVIDATGNQQSMLTSFSFVAHGGKLVFVGLFPGDVTFQDQEFHRRELTLLASRNACAADFTTIIGHMEAGRIDTGPWITHRLRSDQVVQEFAGLLDPARRVIKAMVSF